MRLISKTSYADPTYFIEQVNYQNLAHALVSFSVLPNNQIFAVFRAHVYEEESAILGLP